MNKIASLAALSVLASCSVKQEKKPNIVLIMADDMGFETMNIYGGSSYSTPNISGMAQQGIKFNRCFACPLSTPSRVQLMTGRYNDRNYINFGLIDTNETTFADVLKTKGYKTCIVGKWQLGYDTLTPYKTGFDEYSLWQVISGNDYWHRYKDPAIVENGERKVVDSLSFGDKVFADYACDFIKRNKDENFFLYFPMCLVHIPFVPVPDMEEYDTFEVEGFTDTVYFKNFMNYTDKLVGQIVDEVKKQGIAENTLIMFTGDNGTHHTVQSILNGTAVWGDKGRSTELGTHVPFVAVWPGKILPNSSYDGLVDFTDFLPTIADVAGVDLSTLNTDGHSFLKQLLGEKEETRDMIYCYYDCGKSQFPKRVWVQNKEYKLYETGEFYKYSVDMLEENNLQNKELTEDEKAVKAKLKKELESQMN